MELSAILDDNAQNVCGAIGISRLAERFYLAGGTGLALQLGHRRSLDLDFFQKTESERISFTTIGRDLDRIFGRDRSTLTLKQVDQAVWDIFDTKVTFMAYPFPLMHALVDGGQVNRKLNGLFLASPREIASMKAYALGRRATFRDYADLYHLLHRRIVSLNDIIEDSLAKFTVDGNTVFSTKLFLQQLVYTSDLRDKDATLGLAIGDRPSLQQVETFLGEQVRGFLEKKTGSEEGAQP